MKEIHFTQQDILDLLEKAKIARSAILHMTTLAQSGHPGGSMSSIDLLLALYKMIDFDPANPLWEQRDRVIVSHGHISPAVYSTLGLNSFFNLEDAIAQFRLAGSVYEGHVEPEVPGIEWATGNLGQGLSATVGMALACRMTGINNHLFTLMGDGEQQKGQISEARRFAVKFGMKNLTAIIDYNQLQISGDIHKVMPQNIRANYESDGWQVLEINGHDFLEINQALLSAKQSDVPCLILAHTVMGKGVSFMENKEKYHGSPLNKEQLISALTELGTTNQLEFYETKRQQYTQEELKTFFYHAPQPKINIKAGTPRLYEKDTDNRSAWGNALADLASNPENADCLMAVLDCDLQGSVKTADFEKHRPNAFIQSGIMEHNTAVVAGALSKSGIQTFFADFGVFGVDETYNQQRLNDINKSNLKLITTHVGLDVGEDGKTHQCIDYLGLMRNLFNYHTIIPGDPNQTDHIIRYIAQQYGNYFVPMGRSKLPIIRKANGDILYNQEYHFQYGKADLLRDGSQAALLVMGTLVPQAVIIADELKALGFSVQVWNVSCPQVTDMEMLKKATSTGHIFTYEDHNPSTGLGGLIAEQLIDNELCCKLYRLGVTHYALSGAADDVYRYCELDKESVKHKITNVLK